MAAESALESSIATLVGPLFVANLANAFGYDFSRLKAESKDVASATALGQAMAATICISWCVTFFGYIFLHISYPSHMRKLHTQMKAEKAEAEAAEEAI
jgi:Na+-transporting NADH:ubiquinone oxidoreductase subunit NqrE